MNKLIIIGNVCHSPELRSTQSGKSVCSFDVAVNRRGGDSDTTYFRVSAWNKLAETCQQYISKGKKVMVCGEVTARAYEGKDGTPRASLELMANEVEFLSPKETSQFADPKLAQVTEEQAKAAEEFMRAGFADITDPDLPF